MSTKRKGTTSTQGKKKRTRTTLDENKNRINPTEYIITIWYEPNGPRPEYPWKALYAGIGITAWENDVHYHKLEEFGPDLQLLALAAMKEPNTAFQVDGSRYDSQPESSGVKSSIHQSSDGWCVRNALLNVGVDVKHLDAIGVHKLDTLRRVVDRLTKRKHFPFAIKRITHLAMNVPHIFETGRYVFSSLAGHCMSVTDGLFCDTDPTYPSPTRDLQSLHVGNIITVYRFTPRK